MNIGRFLQENGLKSLEEAFPSLGEGPFDIARSSRLHHYMNEIFHDKALDDTPDGVAKVCREAMDFLFAHLPVIQKILEVEFFYDKKVLLSGEVELPDKEDYIQEAFVQEFQDQVVYELLIGKRTMSHELLDLPEEERYAYQVTMAFWIPTIFFRALANHGLMPDSIMQAFFQYETEWIAVFDPSPEILAKESVDLSEVLPIWEHWDKWDFMPFNPDIVPAAMQVKSTSEAIPKYFSEEAIKEGKVV